MASPKGSRNDDLKPAAITFMSRGLGCVSMQVVFNGGDFAPGEPLAMSVGIWGDRTGEVLLARTGSQAQVLLSIL